MRFLITVLILFPLNANAACQVGTQPVLSCTLSGGRNTLDVCLDGEFLSYAYGKAGKTAELELVSHVKDAGYVPWNGIGRSIYEEASFRNRDVTYTVWFAVDRMAEGNPVSGGVVVLQNEAELASLHCDEGTTTAGFFALSDLMDRMGQCWDYETRVWTTCN